MSKTVFYKEMLSLLDPVASVVYMEHRTLNESILLRRKCSTVWLLDRLFGFDESLSVEVTCIMAIA
ncbi:MAG: hypothetical protein AAF327_16895 [Cyanobacteria bacterium P01_A01_bin.37]